MVGTKELFFIAMVRRSGETSIVEIDLKNNLVKKTLKTNRIVESCNVILKRYYGDNPRFDHDTLCHPLIYHEVSILKSLEEFDIAPKIHIVRLDEFVMSYCGECLNETTKFIDIQERVRFIRECLNLRRISHNDILLKEYRNCLCFNGLLYLIDFQLADVGDIRPSGDFKKVFHRANFLDDEAIFEKVIEDYKK